MSPKKLLPLILVGLLAACGKSEAPKTEAPAAAPAEADDSVCLGVVNNAGLVLLTPFLSMYFERLGWLRDGGFVDELARGRAVFALHRLAGLPTEAPEEQLALNKLLGGLRRAVLWSMLLVVAFSCWTWWRGRLEQSVWMLRGWQLLSPAGFVALLAGWWGLREVLRRPVVETLRRAAE